MEEVTPQTPQAPKLPREVSLALFSASTFEVMEGFLQEVGVADPDVSALSAATYRLASGELSADAYLAQIMEAYQLETAQAQSVAKAVVSQVLVPHRELLDPKIFEGFVEDELSETSVPSDLSIPEEESELDQIKQDKAAILETKGPMDVPAIVNEICSNPAFAFEDEILQERCRKAVESRVRDVRTAQQTRAQLEKAVDHGGLGVTGRRLADILQALEGYVKSYQDRLSQEQADERTQKKKQNMISPDEHSAKEEKILSKRYAELTGKMPEEHIAPVSPKVTRVSAAISAHHEQVGREGKINTEKVRAVVEQAQTRVTSVRPTASSASMREVTFTKRLSGPLDELRTLSLTDFRRLSRDPEQATTKIKDKVDLMEEQGYDKPGGAGSGFAGKVEAIAAWRASSLNQQYVQATREAVLQGTSVTDVLQKKRATGEETLSDEELKAVMKLNADLRF